MSALQQVRKVRRAKIKKFGKRTVRRLDGFFARQSLVGDPPIFDPGVFPFTRMLEDGWLEIRDECARLLEERDRLPSLRSISPDSRRIARNDDWKVFLFYGFGHRSRRNCAYCPRTAALLDGIPGVVNAWFSLLLPRVVVPAHRGITKGLVRCHLGLAVPRDRERCFMSVAGRKIVWEEGRCVVFNDMVEHSVRNDTDEERIVLLIDVHRPLRLAGAVVSRLFLAGMRRTGYVREAHGNQMAWERDFYPSTSPST